MRRVFYVRRENNFSQLRSFALDGEGVFIAKALEELSGLNTIIFSYSSTKNIRKLTIH